MSFEVETPIINSPFVEPRRYWQITPGETPVLQDGRRGSTVFQPREQGTEWDLSDGTIAKIPQRDRAYEMVLVNRIRDRVKAWRAAGYPGATRTTLDLLRWWTRDGRRQNLFFAQVEAVETIIFLKEARLDLRQGITVPTDHVGEQKESEGFRAFERYACKMATGSGKTTVMGMICAWSILNKIADRANATYSDAVLVVCPNVTIRNRLRELSPDEGEASIYRTRDLVSSEMMPMLARGRVLVTNWHVFEPQSMSQGGVSSKVTRMGVPVDTIETVIIGEKNTTARGSRYMTRESFEALLASGEIDLFDDERDGDGNIKKAKIYSRRWVESDTALLARVLGRDIGAKQNILVLNDEAHHAYRISQGTDAEDDAEALTGTAEDDDELAKEATIWVEGLDRVHKHRGVNFCVDLSATPYFLARAGRDTARPFPWTVSDFGLVDAIESGLVKVPQLPASDTTGAERSPYYNIWDWVKGKLTPAERGGARGGFKPNAVLKYAAQPIAMLGGQWRDEWKRWRDDREDPRPPVFIIVCKDTRLSKVVHEWIAEDKCPEGINSFAVEELRNIDGKQYTIRVDTKVVAETDAERGDDDAKGAQADEMRWMRFTLDTVGKLDWPRDRQGNALAPAGFMELAAKLGRPTHPPGRDVRCIVSVGMLTEGWDANTVTHIVGLRPFMSQLLCEQVVGRGLRRASYDVDKKGMFEEEVAQVFGVPFEIVPYKATAGAAPPKVKRFHVHALPERAKYAIQFPIVEGYTQAVRNHVQVDWKTMPTLVLKPGDQPTIVEVQGLVLGSDGKPGTVRFGEVREVTLKPYFAGMRMQEGIFRMARDLTKEYLAVAQTTVPAHVLFPQLVKIVERFVMEHVDVPPSSERRDIFLAPYYGWALEILRQQLRPDTSKGEAPEVPRCESRSGSTSTVDFWTSRDVREVSKSHVNYLVMDTAKWEQQAAFYIDKHRVVEAFVKNAGLDFTIPYLHNGQMHDYVPDFIIRLKGDGAGHLILETKGYDELVEVKRAAAERWVAAVNADGRFGRWEYRLATKVSDVPQILEEMAMATTKQANERSMR